MGTTETPNPHNPLGVKGVGESVTIAGSATMVNAVADTLGPFGSDHLDMPLTPEKLWRATNESSQICPFIREWRSEGLIAGFGDIEQPATIRFNPPG